MKDVGVLSIGYGNVFSVVESLRHLRVNAFMVNKSKEVAEIDSLIIPGVGSFETGVYLLNKSAISQSIVDRHNNGLPILGICLGFQLLSLSSEEAFSRSGLGIFNYSFKKLKSPEIGWREISDTNVDFFKPRPWFYFNHGFGVRNRNNQDNNAVVNSSHFLSFARSKNTIGVQFHPEKSQRAGQNFLRWFLEDF